MSVSRSPSLPSEPRRQRIGDPEALGRNAARTLAVSQGHCWAGMAAVGEIGHHVGVGEAIDARGDLLRTRIWALMRAIAAEARRRGHMDVYAAAVEALGLAAQYEELDSAEDEHRQATGRQASTAAPHLKASAVIHGELLSARSRT